MAGGGASEILRDQVLAAISDRTRESLQISRRIAAGPHPLPEQRLEHLQMLQRELTDEESELCAILRGLRLGDLSFMEEMPPGRLDELLNGRTDRVARTRSPRGGARVQEGGVWASFDDFINGRTDRRVARARTPRGVPLQRTERRYIEAAVRASRMLCESPLASSSAGAVMAASPTARDQAATREELARLQI